MEHQDRAVTPSPITPPQLLQGFVIYTFWYL